MVKFYISDITEAKLIGYHSIKNVIAWCVQNNIQIYDDEEEQYVSHTEFLPAFNEFKRCQIQNAVTDNCPKYQRYYGITEINQIIENAHLNPKWTVIKGGKKPRQMKLIKSDNPSV